MELRKVEELNLDVPAILDLLGLLMRIAGPEKVNQMLKQDGVIEMIGRENLLELILPNLTKEQIKKLIEQNGNR